MHTAPLPWRVRRQRDVRARQSTVTHRAVTLAADGCAEAVRADEARDETERQRDEAERALAGPVQVGVVRAARLRRLGAPANAGNESPLPLIPGAGADAP